MPRNFVYVWLVIMLVWWMVDDWIDEAKKPYVAPAPDPGIDWSAVGGWFHGIGAWSGWMAVICVVALPLVLYTVYTVVEALFGLVRKIKI